MNDIASRIANELHKIGLENYFMVYADPDSDVFHCAGCGSSLWQLGAAQYGKLIIQELILEGTSESDLGEGNGEEG